MGPANNAHDSHSKGDLPRPHVPNERIGHGSQGNTLVSVVAPDRSFIGYIWAESAAPYNSDLHLLTDPHDDHG